MRSIDLVNWVWASATHVGCDRCGATEKIGDEAPFLILEWITNSLPAEKWSNWKERVSRREQFWLEHAFCKVPRKAIDGVGSSDTLFLGKNGKESTRQPKCTFSFGHTNLAQRGGKDYGR